MIDEARKAIGRGDFGRARLIASQILATAPDDLDAIEISALVDIESGDFEAAEMRLRSAIAIAPKKRWPYADLTRLLLRLERPAEAEEVATSALAADPANPDPHAMLGTILAAQERWFEAAGHFELAIALAGPHPQLLTGIGQALLRLGRVDEAQLRLEAASAADSMRLDALIYLAEVEERSGRFDQSKQILDRAEPLAKVAGTDLKLQRSILLQRMGRSGEALALLEQETALSGAALLQRGRIRDRLGRYDDAWADWIQGKSLLAERHGRYYEAEKVKARAHGLVAFFTSSAASALPRASTLETIAKPIFIVGFPRSGTTLTEQILASHSAVRAGGELPFGRELHDIAIGLAGGETAFPAGLLRLDSSWTTKLRDLYLGRAATYGLLRSGAAFFTDKMPTNALLLPLLRLAFPQSPVVHIRRHPLDILVSVMAHDMTHGFHCAYRAEDAARHLALVDDCVKHYAQGGLGPTFELRYETLVADQAGETERLMAAIGLPMEPEQLRFHERMGASPTPSYAQVAEPLNDRSVDRWRSYEKELRSVRPIVERALSRGGYAG